MAKERYVHLKKERDFHRMHHRRVVQEKNKLLTDIKRLPAIQSPHHSLLHSIHSPHVCTYAHTHTHTHTHAHTHTHTHRMREHFSGYEPMLQELKRKYQVSLVMVAHWPQLLPPATVGCDKGEDVSLPGERQGCF